MQGTIYVLFSPRRVISEMQKYQGFWLVLKILKKNR